MKAIFLAILFLPVIASTSLHVIEDTIIRDTNGNVVFPRIPYAIVSAGGGVSMESRQKNGTCFNSVFQSKRAINIGFVPTQESNNGLKTSTNMYVLFPSGCFANVSACTTYAWRITRSGKNFLWFVTSNGGKDSQSSLFTIEKSTIGYYFRFCSNCGEPCALPCMSIGLIKDKGIQKLGLSDVPWVVNFQPAQGMAFLNPFIGPNCAKFP